MTGRKKQRKGKNRALSRCGLAAFLAFLAFLLISATGCSRYSFLNAFRKNAGGSISENQTAGEQEFNYADYLRSATRPEAFTEKVIQKIENLQPVNDFEDRPVEDYYERRETTQMELPENPYELRAADPDQYEAVAGEMASVFFDSYKYENAKNIRDDSVEPERFYSYTEVISTQMIAGDRKKFAVSVLLKLRDVKENSIYTQFGDETRDGDMNCEVVVLGEQTTDYTFTLLGVANTEDVSQRMNLSEYLVRFETLQKTQNDYKIENGVLYVTYDGKQTWKSVPVSMEKLFATRPETEKSGITKLESESYTIAMDRTCFLYGGTQDVPVTLLTSTDAGETWDEQILTDYSAARRCFVGFAQHEFGYILICGDKTGGQEAASLFVSKDGGETWEDEGLVSVTSPALGVIFTDENTGFIQYTSGENPYINMTLDGGRTWETLKIEAPQSYYSMAYELHFENGKGIFYAGQPEYAELAGELYKFESEDGGRTWRAVGKVRI